MDGNCGDRSPRRPLNDRLDIYHACSYHYVLCKQWLVWFQETLSSCPRKLITELHFKIHMTAMKGHLLELTAIKHKRKSSSYSTKKKTYLYSYSLNILMPLRMIVSFCRCIAVGPFRFWCCVLSKAIIFEKCFQLIANSLRQFFFKSGNVLTKIINLLGEDFWNRIPRINFKMFFVLYTRIWYNCFLKFSASRHSDKDDHLFQFS